MDDALEQIDRKVLQLFALVGESVAGATDALLSGDREAAKVLADRDEVVDTLYRDIEQLSAAGVPVYADRGPGGGFQLLDGFRTKLTGLTENEAETLFLSGLPGPATQLGLADQLLSAQLKLSAALPERSRGRLPSPLR